MEGGNAILAKVSLWISSVYLISAQSAAYWGWPWAYISPGRVCHPARSSGPMLRVIDGVADNQTASLEQIGHLSVLRTCSQGAGYKI